VVDLLHLLTEIGRAHDHVRIKEIELNTWNKTFANPVKGYKCDNVVISNAGRLYPTQGDYQ
jgi:hypothetical protein